MATLMRSRRLSPTWRQPVSWGNPRRRRSPAGPTHTPPHVLDRRMVVAGVAGRLMEAAIPKGCLALFCLFPGGAAPSLVGTKAKSGGNRAACRFTCSFRRLTGTPYRAARSESKMAPCPRRIGIARSTRSTEQGSSCSLRGLGQPVPDALLGHCADRSPLHHRCNPKLLREVTRQVEGYLFVRDFGLGRIGLLGGKTLWRHGETIPQALPASKRLEPPDSGSPPRGS